MKFTVLFNALLRVFVCEKSGKICRFFRLYLSCARSGSATDSFWGFSRFLNPSFWIGRKNRFADYICVVFCYKGSKKQKKQQIFRKEYKSAISRFALRKA